MQRQLPFFEKLICAGFLFVCSSGLQTVLASPAETIQTVVSTSAREFAATLEPSGNRIYFNRSSQSGSWHIWVGDFNGDTVVEASPIAFSDNRYDDLDPFVSRSGDRLYFSSDRPLPGSENEDRTIDTNTWYSPLVDGQWGQPVYAGDEVNTRASETYVSESAAGELIFARFGEGRGRARPAYLLVANRTTEGFTAPVQIPTRPAGLRLTNPAISPDGQLIVATGTQGGGPKLYYSRKSAGGAWAVFKPMPAPVNIEGSGQFAPYISNDGEWLYFGSDRNSSGEERNDDIFRTPLKTLVSD